jgi:hypothetical protein
MKFDLDRARIWALGLAGALFLLAAVVENLPGVKLPLGALNLWNDWGMFSKPGAPSVVLVVGKPRDGGEPVIVVNPVEKPEGFADRLRDARQFKLHEGLYKPYASRAVRQSYLAYLCAGLGDRYAQLELRSRTPRGTAGLLMAERTCN